MSSKIFNRVRSYICTSTNDAIVFQFFFSPPLTVNLCVLLTFNDSVYNNERRRGGNSYKFLVKGERVGFFPLFLFHLCVER